MRLVYKKSWKIQQCWLRVGQCGCHKTDYKPNLRDKRKFNAELRRDRNIMIKTF